MFVKRASELRIDWQKLHRSQGVLAQYVLQRSVVLGTSRAIRRPPAHKEIAMPEGRSLFDHSAALRCACRVVWLRGARRDDWLSSMSHSAKTFCGKLLISFRCGAAGGYYRLSMGLRGSVRFGENWNITTDEIRAVSDEAPNTTVAHLSRR
jgi:hypothetical protein